MSQDDAGMAGGEMARSKVTTHTVLPWAAFGLLIALALGRWRSELEPARSSPEQPSSAGTSSPFEASGPSSMPDTRAAGEGVGYGIGSRSYSIELAVVASDDRASSSSAKPWNGQVRRGGPEGDVERVSSLAPYVRGVPGQRCEWISLEVRGQLAQPIRPQFVLGDEAVVTVEAELLLDGAVRAVDATTGHDLPLVDVVLAQAAEGQFLLPPGQGTFQSSTHRAASPVAMPAARGSATYWLGAPGHAWRRITYSGAEGGTPVHALDEGCSLALRRRGGAGKDASVLVSLIRPAREAALEQQFAKTELPEGSDVTFEGLPSGELLARFSVRAGDTPEFVVHEQTVRLEPGDDPTLELDLLQHWTPAAFASLELNLDVTAESELEAYELTLVRTGPQASTAIRKGVTAMRGNDYGLRVWSADALLPGRYRLEVTPSGCSAEFELAAGEAKTLDLALTPAPELRLWCIDASNGAPVKPSLIVCRRTLPGSAETWKSTSFRWAEDACLLRTDAGPIEVGVRVPGFLTAHSLAEVQPGRNEAIVELVPAASIELRVSLWLEDAELPISADEWARARLLDPEGRDSILSVHVGTGTGNPGCCRETAVATLVVGAPGEYELQLEPPPPFRGPIRRSVHLEPTGAELSIQLERLPIEAQR